MPQCKTSCSCSKGRISCSEFCGCKNGGCRNKWNMMRDNDDNNDSDNDDSHDENNEWFYINTLSKSSYLYTTCALSSCN